MKKLHTFESFLNEAKLNEGATMTPEQNHMYTLMDYIIMDYNEDDFDVLEYRIGKKLKKADWKYSDITDDKTAEIKEILKTYYNRKKIITDKFLNNPAKKWQDLITAMKWLNA